ncbi:uncharacterized protein LOC127783949 [Oryza glaberrima]|uniref:uncharacterized protein LOC127783949 n=1 Tax=Oryza glaberrima TaxID=4538 RepID=UPI00224C297A|nr:uncharacterized protein LOC127783949 [Oryza glaberrima]
MHGELRDIEKGEESGGFSLHGCSSKMTLFPYIWSPVQDFKARSRLQAVLLYLTDRARFLCFPVLIRRIRSAWSKTLRLSVFPHSRKVRMPELMLCPTTIPLRVARVVGSCSFALAPVGSPCGVVGTPRVLLLLM